jgi:hypothetical protein
MKQKLSLILALLILTQTAFAEEDSADENLYLARATRSSECSDMQVWDVGMGMCMPLAMKGMPMSMFMLSGNAFGVQGVSSGPRGRSAFSAPNMFMADLGTSIGDSHYLNLDYMGTFELWSFPEQGYPLLTQIGESQKNGQPFLDAQHPHNSPIMGLTLSDTIRFNDDSKDHLKISFAPRGESGDGPVAFMHRATGMANPDAPLGHHIAQDVGHISSTVIAASLKLGATRIEASTFNGEEPEPTSTDLHPGTPNSYSLRLVREFSDRVMAMASVAYVKEPEHHDPDLPFVMRYSASLYTEHPAFQNWTLHTTSIFGLITKYDHAATLVSFGEEFLLRNEVSHIFGRFEALQRTPEELAIANLAEANTGRFIGALTLGYTHVLAKTTGLELGVGTSATMNLLPEAYASSYGSSTPWTGKIFLQLGGMGMWDF